MLEHSTGAVLAIRSRSWKVMMPGTKQGKGETVVESSRRRGPNGREKSKKKNSCLASQAFHGEELSTPVLGGREHDSHIFSNGHDHIK